MKRGNEMPYKVVSEISNTSGSTFATYDEFASWYHDETHTSNETKIGELIENDWEIFNNIEVTNAWDADRQVATKIRLFTDLTHYNGVKALYETAGIRKPLETIIEEVEV